MPIYEYECKKCGRSFEAIHSFNDPPPHKCEHCGASGKGVLVKLISPAQVVFKGSGFYVTDHKGARHSTIESGADNGREGGADASSKAKETAAKPGKKTKGD
ncbi:MAG: zinc ribbon domain-containing protein [bacterium]|jgi:putative FmdB family regulatory protein